MKKYAHLLWYALGLLSLAGLWLHWDWASEPLFPLVCFLSGRLTRHELRLQPTIFDRPFENRWMEKFAIGSIAVMMLTITGWFLYVKYVWGPANERAGVQEYLDAREAMMKGKTK